MRSRAIAKTIEFRIPTGTTLTGKMFPLGAGSDTSAETIATITEKTNDKGTAQAVTTVTGPHRLVLLNGSDFAGNWYGNIPAADPSFTILGDLVDVDWSQVYLPTSTNVLSGTTVANSTLLAGATTVVLTDGSLTAAKIGADAFTAAKFAADVTIEFQAGLATAAGLATVSSDLIAAINALNQSASRRVTLAVSEPFERPESGSVTYTIQGRTYTADGAAVNADSTPTLTATGIVSGSLAANLSAATNSATGVYDWVYTVTSGATLEQIKFDLSAVIATETFTMTNFSQTADFVAATFTTADRTKLEAIHTKLPSRSFLAGATASTGATVGTDTITLADASLTTAKLGTFALAKGTNVTGFNDLSAAQVNTEADTALSDAGVTTVRQAKLDSLTFTTANRVDATAVSVSDKTGYGLASTGLDSIPVTAPTGVATTFREMVVQTWRRWFKKATLEPTTIKTYADNGTDVLTTQIVSETVGVIQTQGPAT